MDAGMKTQVKLFRHRVVPKAGWLHRPKGPGLEPGEDAIRAAIRD